MKKSHYLSSLLLIVMCINIGSAQKNKLNEYSKLYREIISKKSSYDAHSLNLEPIQKTNSNFNFDKSVDYAEFYKFENLKSRNQKSAPPYFVEIAVPFKGNTYNCLFERNYVKSSSYSLRTSEKQKNQPIETQFYKGIVEGQPNSWATLAIIDGTYRILIAHDKGNIEVNQVSKDIYAAYDSKDQKVIPEFICEYVDKSIDKEPESSVRIGSDCLELYIECDFQSYLDNGSSVNNTEAWAMSIINDVSTIYSSINVPLVVSEIFVWNSTDPYINESNLSEVRDSFVSHIQNNYTGRVAQLFSTRPLSGGLAYGIGGLCGEYPDFPGPYSIATELSTSYDPYPNFSFTVNVVAHELGHVLGARHTHACVWGPNSDTQIDDCGNIYAADNGDTPEGTGCFDDQSPILPMDGGTVMSFCNLAGGGIDLANGFGTEVGDYIFEKYNTAICATGNECASIPPSNDDCVNALHLNLKGQCSYFTYDNIMSTPSGVANPSCGTPGVAQDIWFSITPTNEDALINFNPISGGVENVIITAYSGTCGNLTEIKCEEAFNEEIQVKLSGLTPNATIYIRIIEEGSNVEGTFMLCAIDESLPCHPAINGLVDLYNMTNGNNWTNNTGWDMGAQNTNCSPCNWFGITCDNQENIIEIDLTNNNLSGTIPSTLEDLTKLRSIKLLINNLTGNFPDIWSDMSDLEYIDLSNNQFTGSMPNSLGNLMTLHTLYIENNNMTGNLLPEIGNLPKLDVYWAKGNNFSGCFPGTYLNICDIGSITFINNPQLPNSGILDLFCADGTGGDIDEDGFCLGIGVNDDCDDTDNTIYPSAPEICDGKDNNCNGEYDENITSTNTWITSGSGDWQNISNWSLGTIPKPCEDIVIPASASLRTITIPTSSDAYGRSLSVGENSNVTNNGNLAISGSDDDGIILMQNSSFTNYGLIDIFSIANTGVITSGLVENHGTINVSNLSSSYELYIQENGEVDNKTGSQIVLKQ